MTSYLVMWNCNITHSKGIAQVLDFSSAYNFLNYFVSPSVDMRRLRFQGRLLIYLPHTYILRTNRPFPELLATACEVSSQPAENPKQLGDAVIYCCPNRTFHTINTWSSRGYILVWLYTFVWVVCLVGYIQNVLFPLVQTRSISLLSAWLLSISPLSAYIAADHYHL